MSNERAINSLRKSVKKNKTDTFEVGTVIRWTAAGRFTYAVIKTAIGWVTTAGEYNSFIGRVVDYDTLTEYLAKSETSDIEVATGWEAIL